MNHLTRGGWLLVAVLIAAAARAQSTDTVGATFVVASQVKLTLSLSALTFPDADPDLQPLIPAWEGPITITAKARATFSNEIILTVLATDDLRSGMDVIPIAQLAWTTTGAGLTGGTMSHTLAQRVATWTSSGTFAGTQTFTLGNSWTYPTGSYGMTVTYTLTTP
jgi:hypothetical protein